MKNVTTRVLLIIILLLGLVSFCKNIISTTTTKDSVNVTKPDTKELVYSNLLKKLTEELKDCPDAKFSIGYIDNDREPDIFVSTGYSHINGVKIYLSANDDFIEVKPPEKSGFGEFGKTIYIPYNSTVCDYAMYYGEEHFKFYRAFRTGTRLMCSLKRVNREKNTEYYIDEEAVSKGEFERNLNEYYRNQNYVSTLEYEKSFDITEENIRSVLARKSPLSSVAINKNDKETITLYSKNGKSIEVMPSEKEAYNAKGWYTAPASGKAELLDMLYGTWITDDERYKGSFVDFHGEKIDTGWVTEYCSYGRIKSITLVKNNTYKIKEKATLAGYEEPDEVINNEFDIYYEGGNEFQMITDDGAMTMWKYVGTIEDMLNMP